MYAVLPCSLDLAGKVAVALLVDRLPKAGDEVPYGRYRLWAQDNTSSHHCV